MSRILKFRAWHQDSKMASWEELLKAPAVLVDMLRTERPRTTLMQYTGLTDKNGKEIYEGDLLRPAPDGYEPRKIIEVEWNENTACFIIPQPLAYYEVIGNIYENPELLK